MNEDGNKRRDFLSGLLRGAAGVALAGLAGKLLIGRRDDDRHRCINDSLCRDCGRYDDCVLPQAEALRRSTS